MTLGQMPTRGLELIDGQYVNGIANGNNATFQTLTAKAGGTQAAATPISATAAMVNVSVTATNGDSVVLNFAVAGRQILLVNSGAATLSVYGQVSGNKANGNVVDKINGTVGSTAYPVTTGQSVKFFCPTNGLWYALKSA